MNKELNIFTLRMLRDQYEAEHMDTEVEAFDEAIKRLEQPEIIRCKDCKHKPTTTPDYNFDDGDCGFEIEFPDYRCPCQCDDGWYNRLPEDDWFCGNAERREDGSD